MSSTEEKIFGDAIPIEICNTGGTIPKDVGDINQLRHVLEDMKDFGKDLGAEFSKKTY